VLVIAGGKDRGAPASIVRRIAKKYQTVSTYKEFAHHSHWLMAEAQWQEVVAYIVGWLESQKKP
jgi:pimeloyl-ACP methyl ester carboxylesterase